MKAVLARAAGGPEVLSSIEQPVPQPRDGEVRVRALSIGVNYADVLCRQAVHQSMRPPPIIPGCEAAGIVEACGAGVSRHRVGDRVGVYSPFGGAYAEALVVPENYALSLPEGMSFEEGAAFTHVYLSAHEALNASAPPRPGASVLVTAAAGGLGGAVLQLAAALELRVIAAVGSPTKRQMLLDRGIETVIDYGTSHLTEAVLEVTDGRGVDVAIEALGTQPTFEAALRVLRPGGTLSSLGVYSTDLTIPLGAFAAGLGDHRIVTTLCPGGKERMRRLINVIQSGRVDLTAMVTHRYKLDDIEKAYDLFAHQRDGVLKVAITP